MTGNRSLDEFVADDPADEEPTPSRGSSAVPSGGDAASATADTDTDTDTDTHTDGDAFAEDDAADRPAVEPMAETFAWSAAGGACERCGEAVETRWRDGETLVCVECKDW